MRQRRRRRLAGPDPLRRAAGGRIELVGFPRAFTEDGWVADRPISVERYAGAYATPFRPLPADDGPSTFAGALYDAGGALIGESERLTGRGRKAENAASIARPPARPTLAGEHVYLGAAIQSYGHFLLEILSQLWWVERREDLAGLSFLLHGWKGRQGEERPRSRWSFLGPLAGPLGLGPPPAGATGFMAAPWVAGFLEILGVDPDRLVFVPSTGARIDAVRVPSRVVTVNGHVHPAFPRIYRLIAALAAGDVPAGDARLYLSRSKVRGRRGEGGAKRSAANEAELEALLAGHGFRIVHPQELSIVEQIRLVRSASVIAGCDGSALHNVAFARPGTRVLAIDARVVENQFAIEEACGLTARHLWMGTGGPYRTPENGWRIDLDRVARNLDFLEGAEPPAG